MKYLKYLWRQIRITRSFPDKLNHNYHELTIPEKALYLVFIRPFFSPTKRFFFDGSLGLLGQMYIEERRAIYEAIVKYQPKRCFEIGTYTGGGSTFFIASAFAKLGKGQLITMESDEHLYVRATNYYRKNLPKLNSFIKFIHNSKTATFDEYFHQDNYADCVFFDGAEDQKETIEQYHYFLPHFRPGSIIIMHDWNTEKMKQLRPIIVNDHQWQIVKELKPPQSVGLAIAKRTL